jgi:hypothetical protein
MYVANPRGLTVRGRTLCYECFDEGTRCILDPVGHADQRMRERVREIDRRYVRRAQTGILRPAF